MAGCSIVVLWLLVMPIVILGAGLALDHVAVLALSVFIAAECVRVDGMVYLFFLVLTVVLKVIVAHRLYRIAAPERYKMLSVISVLPLGLLRPIFLFALRKKVCMFSKNT